MSDHALSAARLRIEQSTFSNIAQAVLTRGGARPTTPLLLSPSPSREVMPLPRVVRPKFPLYQTPQSTIGVGFADSAALFVADPHHNYRIRQASP